MSRQTDLSLAGKRTHAHMMSILTDFHPNFPQTKCQDSHGIQEEWNKPDEDNKRQDYSYL